MATPRRSAPEGHGARPRTRRTVSRAPSQARRRRNTCEAAAAGRAEKLGELGRSPGGERSRSKRVGCSATTRSAYAAFPPEHSNRRLPAIGVFCTPRRGREGAFARLRGDPRRGQRVANRRRATHVRRGAAPAPTSSFPPSERVEVQAETRGDGGDQPGSFRGRTPMESPGSYAPPAPAAVRSNPVNHPTIALGVRRFARETAAR